MLERPNPLLVVATTDANSAFVARLASDNPRSRTVRGISFCIHNFHTRPALGVGYASAMARVRLFHWNAAEAQTTLERLREGGHQVEYEERLLPGLLTSLRRSSPDAVVIDLSRLPSQGREIAVAIRGSKSTRHLPIIFAGGSPEKLRLIREQLPDANYCQPANACAALRAALKNVPTSPIVPVQMMDRFAARSVCQKLGIAEQKTVYLIDPPRGYEQILAPLPERVQFTEAEPATAAVTLWFVREPYALESSLHKYRSWAASTKFWIVWPKQKRGSKGGFTETLIREKAIAVGLVDYKVCSVDQIWSAMLFARTKAPG